MMKNKSKKPSTFCNILGKKLAYEYHWTKDDYPKSMNSSDIISDAYKKASDLFNTESETSIVYITLNYYMEHLDEALELFTGSLEDFAALSKLLPAYIRAIQLLHEDKNTLYGTLSKELKENKDYYHLFPLNYFLELALTDGIDTSLKELETDTSIRAFTYYNATYNDYLALLPGLKELIEAGCN